MADNSSSTQAPADPEMVEVLIREIQGLALEWLVAKCEGLDVFVESIDEQAESIRNCVLVGGQKPSAQSVAAAIALIKPKLRVRALNPHLQVPSYSTDWRKGGQIIDSNPHMQFWHWGGEQQEEMQCACLPVKQATTSWP